MSLTPVTTDRKLVSVSLLGSNSVTAVPTSNVGSVVGTISITLPAVSLVISVTTDHVATLCSLSGSCASVVSAVFDTLVVVISVTTDRSEGLDSLGGFVVSDVLSLVSMGCVTGRSGRVSSGSVVALLVFVLFAFGQCLGQCLVLWAFSVFSLICISLSHKLSSSFTFSHFFVCSSLVRTPYR